MPMTVMIIEDNYLFRRALERLIAAEGYRPVTFASAEEALSSPEIDCYNVALLDLHLPGMWGDEMAQELARQGHVSPIAFVTSEASAEKRLKKQVPGCEVISKPADLSRLLEFLHDASARLSAPRQH